MRDLYTKYKINFFSCLFGLFIVHSMFYALQMVIFEQRSNTIVGSFFQQVNRLNMYELSRAIKKLESDQLIECSILKSSKLERQYINLTAGKNCNESFIFLDGINQVKSIKLPNGEEFEFKFKALNSRLFYILYFSFQFVFILLSQLVVEYFKSRKEKEDLKAAHASEMLKITTQLAHDIKSPLAALEIVMDDIRDLPEDSRELTLNAVNRIQEIANNLNKNDTPDDEDAFLISNAVYNTIKEKRLEYSNNEIKINFIDSTDHMQFVTINSTDISRIISNLINNSAQAFDYVGSISITISESHNSIIIHTKDSGNGFPNSMLNKPITRGNTIGKKGGQGLGLHHAYETTINANGEFEIFNNDGANVKISIPKATVPDWFKGQIDFDGIKELVIIDDDQSIHDLWKKVLADTGNKLQTKNAKSEQEIIEALSSISYDQLVLIDNDLRISKTGVELIKEYNLKKVILVTSGYEDLSIKDFCLKSKIQLLPKYLIKHIIKY